MSSLLVGEKLSFDQLAELVCPLFPGWSATVAVAIIMAESGGWTQAVRHNGTSLDLGLFQTNTFWNPSLPVADALTPVTQVKYVEQMASQKPQYGYNWKLWNTYKNGLHTPFLHNAQAAVKKFRGQ